MGSVCEAVERVQHSVRAAVEGWQEAHAAEMERRQRMEGRRELVRVIVRAWREIADGRGAGRGAEGALTARGWDTRARGKSGPLFHFDVHDDVRLRMDARVEKDESHAGKVVERRWYSRHKHIFPYSRWEVYDPDKTFERYTVRDSKKPD